MAIMQKTDDGTLHTVLAQYTSPKSGITWVWTVPVNTPESYAPQAFDARLMSVVAHSPGDTYQDAGGKNPIKVLNVYVGGDVRFQNANAAPQAPDMIMSAADFEAKYTKAP